jgi:hypothetical protein
MKQKPRERALFDLDRYDWPKASRGRFAARFPAKKKPAVAVRVLDDDLLEAFPDSESVNRALHAIVDAARRVVKARRRRPAA